MKAAHQATVMVDHKTYEVLGVKKGGMGKVWLLQSAYDDGHDAIYRRQIAVKTFGGAEEGQEIERELNIWISLQHESILPLRKIGRLDYTLAAIMPKMDGDLNDLMENTGPFAERQIIKVLGRVVGALSYAWKQFRILHLDLKPSNLLTNAQAIDAVRVADWGISRIARPFDVANVRHWGAASSDRTAYAAGTPLFMAPERFSKSWSMEPCVDIYSLGMMAIYLATGALPFNLARAEWCTEIISGAYYENARKLLQPHSGGFREFCLACVHPHPSARAQDYARVERMLRAI